MTGFAVYVTGDTAPLAKIDAYLAGFDANARSIFYTTASEVYADLYKQLLDTLRFYPPVPAGSKYKRTFKLRNGWDVSLEQTDNGFYIVVRNATAYTRWVVGRLINDEAQARATQRAFHARNGWPVALDTTRIWFEQFKEAFIAAFVDALLADAKAKTSAAVQPLQRSRRGSLRGIRPLVCPVGWVSPLLSGREVDSVPPSLPYVEVYVNPTQGISQPRGSDSYEVTRRFIVRLYTGVMVSDTPSIEDPEYTKAENCIEVVEDYFYFTDDRLNVAGVLTHRLLADTAGVVLFARANRNYIGVAFEHSVTYTRNR